jgi:glutathione S-transferase
VIEPGALAKRSAWDFKPSQAGWGDYDSMLATIESAIDGREFILGDTFSIADVVFGGTLRYLLRFQMLEPRPLFTAYVDRLSKRPAAQRADARNAAVIAEHGLATR